MMNTNIAVFLLLLLCSCVQIGNSSLDETDGHKCELKAWYMDALAEGLLDDDDNETDDAKSDVKVEVLQLVRRKKGLVYVDCSQIEDYDRILRGKPAPSEEATGGSLDARNDSTDIDTEYDDDSVSDVKSKKSLNEVGSIFSEQEASGTDEKEADKSTVDELGRSDLNVEERKRLDSEKEAIVTTNNTSLQDDTVQGVITDIGDKIRQTIDKDVLGDSEEIKEDTGKDVIGDKKEIKEDTGKDVIGENKEIKEGTGKDVIGENKEIEEDTGKDVLGNSKEIKEDTGKDVIGENKEIKEDTDKDVLGNSKEIKEDTGKDVIGDNKEINEDTSKDVIGDKKEIKEDTGKDVIGENKEIKEDTDKDILGYSKEIKEDTGKDVKGDNKEIKEDTGKDVIGDKKEIKEDTGKDVVGENKEINKDTDKEINKDTDKDVLGNSKEIKEDTGKDVIGDNKEIKEDTGKDVIGDKKEIKEDTGKDIIGENKEIKKDTGKDVIGENKEIKEDTDKDVLDNSKEIKQDTGGDAIGDNKEIKEDTVKDVLGNSKEIKEDTVKDVIGDKKGIKEDNGKDVIGENKEIKEDTYKDVLGNSKEIKEDTARDVIGDKKGIKEDNGKYVIGENKEIKEDTSKDVLDNSKEINEATGKAVIDDSEDIKVGTGKDVLGEGEKTKEDVNNDVPVEGEDITEDASKDVIGDSEEIKEDTSKDEEIKEDTSKDEEIKEDTSKDVIGDNEEIKEDTGKDVIGKSNDTEKDASREASIPATQSDEVKTSMDLHAADVLPNSDRSHKLQDVEEDGYSTNSDPSTESDNDIASNKYLRGSDFYASQQLVKESKSGYCILTRARECRQTTRRLHSEGNSMSQSLKRNEADALKTDNDVILSIETVGSGDASSAAGNAKSKDKPAEESISSDITNHKESKEKESVHNSEKSSDRDSSRSDINGGSIGNERGKGSIEGVEKAQMDDKKDIVHRLEDRKMDGNVTKMDSTQGGKSQSDTNAQKLHGSHSVTDDGIHGKIDNAHSTNNGEASSESSQTHVKSSEKDTVDKDKNTFKGGQREHQQRTDRVQQGTEKYHKATEKGSSKDEKPIPRKGHEHADSIDRPIPKRGKDHAGSSDRERPIPNRGKDHAESSDRERPIPKRGKDHAESSDRERHIPRKGREHAESRDRERPIPRKGREHAESSDRERPIPKRGKEHAENTDKGRPKYNENIRGGSDKNTEKTADENAKKGENLNDKMQIEGNRIKAESEATRKSIDAEPVESQNDLNTDQSTRTDRQKDDPSETSSKINTAADNVDIIGKTTPKVEDSIIKNPPEAKDFKGETPPETANSINETSTSLEDSISETTPETVDSKSKTILETADSESETTPKVLDSINEKLPESDDSINKSTHESVDPANEATTENVDSASKATLEAVNSNSEASLEPPNSNGKNLINRTTSDSLDIKSEATLEAVDSTPKTADSASEPKREADVSVRSKAVPNEATSQGERQSGGEDYKSETTLELKDSKAETPPKGVVAVASDKVSHDKADATATLPEESKTTPAGVSSRRATSDEEVAASSVPVTEGMNAQGKTSSKEADANSGTVDANIATPSEKSEAHPKERSVPTGATSGREQDGDDEKWNRRSSESSSTESSSKEKVDSGLASEKQNTAAYINDRGADGGSRVTFKAEEGRTEADDKLPNEWFLNIEQRYSERIQSLELQISRMQNHMLQGSFDVQLKNSAIDQLEKHILRLEGEILRFNHTFRDLQSEHKRLLQNQKMQLQQIESSKELGEPGFSKKNTDGGSSCLLAVAEQENKIKHLSEMVQKQSALLEKLQEKFHEVEGDNHLLVKQILNQSILLNEVLAKMNTMNEEQEWHKNKLKTIQESCKKSTRWDQAEMDDGESQIQRADELDILMGRRRLRTAESRVQNGNNAERPRTPRILDKQPVSDNKRNPYENGFELKTSEPILPLSVTREEEASSSPTTSMNIGHPDAFPSDENPAEVGKDSTDLKYKASKQGRFEAEFKENYEIKDALNEFIERSSDVEKLVVREDINLVDDINVHVKEDNLGDIKAESKEGETRKTFDDSKKRDFNDDKQGTGKDKKAEDDYDVRPKEEIPNEILKAQNEEKKIKVVFDESKDTNSGDAVKDHENPPTQEEVKPKEVISAEVKPAEVKPTEVKPEEVKPTEVKPTEVKSEEVKPTEENSAEVKPTEVKPAEVKPTEVKPTEVNTAEVNSAEVKPTEVKPTEVKPTEVKPAEVKPTEVNTAEVKPTEVKPAEVKPTEVKPAEVKPTEVNTAEVKPTEVIPTEVKPADVKLEEVKPAEVKPTEVKSAEVKPAEVKPAEAKPTEVKPAEASDDSQKSKEQKSEKPEADKQIHVEKDPIKRLLKHKSTHPKQPAKESSIETPPSDKSESPTTTENRNPKETKPNINLNANLTTAPSPESMPVPTEDKHSAGVAPQEKPKPTSSQPRSKESALDAFPDPPIYDRRGKGEMKDCYDHYTKGRRHNTPLRIKLGTGSKEVEVYCDMKNGGWTLIQRRQDGAVDFYRNWIEYKNGFGSIYGEHWIGNDNIHLLTNQDHYRLRIELTDWDRNTHIVDYDRFRITDESDGYRIFVAGYQDSPAGDSLTKHHGNRFSTMDVDHDLVEKEFDGSCARRFSGAWWYFKCYKSNLNGKYYRGGSVDADRFDGVAWKSWTGSKYSLKKVEMKVLPRSAKPGS